MRTSADDWLRIVIEAAKPTSDARRARMCGIAGRLGPDVDPRVDRMVASLAHRGPDAAGAKYFTGCSLGMRRLRVVDLRPEADQPMTGESGRIWLVYNGELYNHPELRVELEALGHAFRSQSDTEVIVHGYEQWGEDVVRRLRGMFAFAIWDDGAQRLLLARDRLGIKPLYLLDEEDGGLSFASEVRAFGSRELDPIAVATYLRLGWTGSCAISVGVREMAPGSLLVVDKRGQRSRTYWHPVWRDEALDLELLGSALTDSVDRHLEADVPVGIFLSSGLDSSVVATLAARNDRNVKAYTVAYGGTTGDETPAARALADDLGLKHQCVTVNGDEVVAQAPSIIRDMDQPTVDGVNSWIISKAVREAGMTVALSGLGGDELFEGYSTFRKAPRIAAISRLPTQAVAQRASSIASRSVRLRDSRGHRAVEAVALGGLPNAYAAVRAVFPLSSVARLWPAGADLLASATDPDLLATARPDQSVGQLELGNYLRYQLLRDTDVMSMAHSLEVRVPLLDDRVVNAALVTRPPVTGSVGKSSLALAAGVPMSFATQRKMTFTLPFDRWLRSDLRPWALESLDLLGRSPLGFDHKAVMRSYDDYSVGRLGWRSLWALASLGGWVGARQT